MPRIISSVEVISQHPEGTDWYRIGNKIQPENVAIAWIEEHDINGGKTYLFFDERQNLIQKIENCPVVVRYKEGVQ